MCELCITTSGLSRRGFLGSSLGAAGLAAAGMMAAAGLPSAAAWAETAPKPNAIAPEEALKRLKAGNARYAADKTTHHDFSARRMARSRAQYPIAAIVSCADSRVAPEFAFDQTAGELFVCRVAGNFVNTDGLASLEYGVKILGIPLIMVLGHSGCGAIGATIKVVQENVTLPGHLPELVNALKPGIEAAIAQKPKDLLAAATIENVRYNAKQLKAATPIIAQAVADKKVMVVGAVYDIATGKVNLVEV